MSRLFPTLAGYQRSWLRADAVAGLVTAAVVIPQAMAYATVAKLPVQFGLYTCVVPLAVYAALGGARRLSVTTTSTIALLTGTVLLSASTHRPDAADLATLAVATGLILLLGRLLDLGFLADDISEPVLTGVKAAVGLTIATSQIPRLTGITVPEDGGGFVSEIEALVHATSGVQAATLLLSAATLVTIVLLRRFAPALPAPLLALVAAAAGTTLLDLRGHGVMLVPPTPGGLPPLSPPHWEHLGRLLPTAAAIALFSFVESVAAARALRSPADDPLDENRELLAIGVANTAGGLLSSIPVAGGFSQSSVTARAGARSQLSQVVVAAVAVVIVTWLTGLPGRIPVPALAILVLFAVSGLMNPAAFVALGRISRTDLAVALVTMLVGLVGGLLAAVGAGIVITLWLLLRELGRPELYAARPADAPGLLLVRLDTYLYTANVRAMAEDLVDAVCAARPAARVVVLGLPAQRDLNATVLDELDRLRRRLAEQDVDLWFADITPAALRVARRASWWRNAEAAGAIWPTTTDAVNAYQHLHPSSPGDDRSTG
ncbi:SulP family inorganic anion transporter [Spirillospora sp. NPDC052269]